jgi:hypothetical protein
MSGLPSENKTMPKGVNWAEYFSSNNCEANIAIGYNTVDIFCIQDGKKVQADKIRKMKQFPKEHFRLYCNKAGKFDLLKLVKPLKKVRKDVEKSVALDLRNGMMFMDVARKYILCGQEMEKIMKKYQTHKSRTLCQARGV